MADELRRFLTNTALSRRSLLRTIGWGGGAWAGGVLLRGGVLPVMAAEPTGHSNVTPGSPIAAYTLRAERKEVAPAGTPVPAILLNGNMPGPELRVKEGELFRVQLQNALPDTPTTIHWHGLLVPAAMDGVPGISQDPVAPGQVFVYEYPIRQTGTYWYHSHYGFQEQIGCSGALIIEPRHESLKYDHDVVLFISDWLNSNPEAIIPTLRQEAEKMGGMKMGGPGGSGDKAGMKTEGPDPRPTMGQNKGSMQMGGGPDLADVKYSAFLLNGKANGNPWTCKARPGQRIRFRIINGSGSTFFRFMIDSHSLLITHADGEAVRPLEVDNLLLGTAECYDVLVTAGASGAYTIRAEAQDGSGAALGVLHTPDAQVAMNPGPPKWGARQLSYAQLQAVRPTTLPEGPLNSFKLVLGGNMGKYIWNINDQYYPQADPLLIQEGQRVQVEIFNNTDMFHPMHLHGHFFRLLSRTGEDPLAPLKHTVSVAPKATVKFEFAADNPGRWFFHCHNLYHLETGMARQWQYKI